MNIAIAHYLTKYGIDSILFRTHKEMGQLPFITNSLLETAGVPEPDVEGEEATEEAYWIETYPIEDLPLLE